MEGLVVLGVVIAALGLLAILAVAFGVDSREGATEPRSPERGLSV
jgi:hypothetical protein